MRRHAWFRNPTTQLFHRSRLFKDVCGGIRNNKDLEGTRGEQGQTLKLSTKSDTPEM